MPLSLIQAGTQIIELPECLKIKTLKQNIPMGDKDTTLMHDGLSIFQSSPGHVNLCNHRR